MQIKVAQVRGRLFKLAILSIALVFLPSLVAFQMLDLWSVDLSVPFLYTGGDEIWQLVLTKMALDSGWILTSPFMGAPDVAHWHNNAAAQTSAIHSVLMRCIGFFVPNSVATQQIYFLINFSLISITGFIACRLLKISTLLSLCVCFIYAFSVYRYNAVVYAFLVNYFIIPLAVIPAIWVMTGRMAAPKNQDSQYNNYRSLSRTFGNRHFLVSLPIVALVGVSDGYYAFFTLLLLGCAIIIRILRGDIVKPMSLVAPLFLVATLLTVVLTLTAPLREYQHQHPEEFRPNGVVDTTLTKQAFEAEVYSTSIKMMLAPHDRHRIGILSDLGRWMLETSNKARSFKAVIWVPLGTLASLLLLGLFFAIPAMLVGPITFPSKGRELAQQEVERLRNLGAATGLALFVTLTSVAGGIGTLIALIYPTIRAYDRFPLFLIFLLYVAAGLLGTLLIRYSGVATRRVFAVMAPIITVLAIIDQTPVNTIQRDSSVAPRFLAERHFVQSIEASLPERAMVYQFPHSQYLTNSHYYGWGDFQHVRLYLHSRHLRWSNGAAKNSWVDSWHMRMGQLSTVALVTEMRAVGFRGFVVDRRVVKDNEYVRIRTTLIDHLGQAPVEDDVAGLAFWTLTDPGFRITYDPQFRNVDRITVENPRLAEGLRLPRLVRRDALLRVLAALPVDKPAVIEREAYPDVFRDAEEADRGLGTAKIEPLEAMQSDISCGSGMHEGPLSIGRDSLTIRIANRSEFEWHLNSGPLPLRLGLKELVSNDGTRLRWDGGFRLAGNLTISSGETVEVRLPLSDLKLSKDLPGGGEAIVAVFSMLQEGHAWFGMIPGNTECRVSLVP